MAMAMAAAASSLRSLRALSISRALSPLPLLRVFASRLLHQGDLEEGRRGDPGSIHPTAVVHAYAVIGQGVMIGPFCTIGSSARIGNACQLHAGSHIMGDTELGERCIVLTQVISAIYILVTTMIFDSIAPFIDLQHQVTRRLLVTTTLLWGLVILPMTAKLATTIFSQTTHC